MEMSGLVCNAGTIWAFRAASGRQGKSKIASCVECMSVPLGLAMVIGVVVGTHVLTGVSMGKKWLVHPESAIPTKELKLGAGGPTLDKIESV